MTSFIRELPSIPRIPSVAPLHLGITTRVMAKRQALERERRKSDPNSEYDNRDRRRSSRFLEGAMIPNSVIRAEIEAPEIRVKGSLAKKERDEFVEKLLIRLQPHKKMHSSMYDEEVDREALDKIKKELQRRSLASTFLSLSGAYDEDRKSISIESNSISTKPIDKDPWEELKEKRRISRRTSILAPLSGEKRPTYDSIKKAIESSKIIQQLLDADQIEEQKMKSIQTSKSLMVQEVNKEHEPTKATKIESAMKLPKREGSKMKIGKEKKSAKRRSSGKLDTFIGAAPVDKPLVRKRGSTASKKESKRSLPPWTLKEELHRQSSLIINSILQQRKHSS